jgi:hypothetical protein
LLEEAPRVDERAADRRAARAHLCFDNFRPTRRSDRNVQVRRRRQQARAVDLARRRRGRSPPLSGDVLRGVVDDDCELVGREAVGASRRMLTSSREIGAAPAAADVGNRFVADAHAARAVRPGGTPGRHVPADALA